MQLPERFSGYTKNHNTHNILRILVIGIALFLLIAASSAYAQQNQAVLEKNISSVNQRIQTLEAEIRTYRERVTEVGQAKQTLENELKQIKLEYEKIQTDIQLNRSQIDLATLEISDITRDILRIENSIGVSRQALEQSMRAIYEIDHQSFLEKILARDRIADFWREADELQTFQDDVGNHINELKSLQERLRSQRSESQERRDDLALLQTQIKDRVTLAEEQKEAQEQLLQVTQNEEARYQKLLQDRVALKKAFEDELFAYESQLQVILDPTALPRPGSAPLSWPLDNVFITQRFGKTVDSQRLYLSGSHSGSDFRANGDPVYAMADGVVGGTGNTDIACPRASFGKWIFVRFDNNLAATYGHLSLIKVQTGQRVKRGDLLGYSGNTGHSTGPHLHISLYAGIDANGNSPVEIKGKESLACTGATLIQPRAAREAYLDPLEYLPTTTPDMFKNRR